jgi:hypothetical protein
VAEAESAKHAMVADATAPANSAKEPKRQFQNARNAMAAEFALSAKVLRNAVAAREQKPAPNAKEQTSFNCLIFPSAVNGLNLREHLFFSI